MQGSIIAAQDDKNGMHDCMSIETIEYYAAVLDDFQHSMYASAADEFLGVDNGTIGKAYRRGEIKGYRLPDKKLPKFGPLALGMWLDEYCKPDDIKTLPS